MAARLSSTTKLKDIPQWVNMAQALASIHGAADPECQNRAGSLYHGAQEVAGRFQISNLLYRVERKRQVSDTSPISALPLPAFDHGC
jgi:hypothetical protein